MWRLAIYPALKRGFDIAATLLIMPFALIAILALALIVRADGSPAFFGQPRIGKNGRVFTLWKLRTMVPNAEQKLKRYLEENTSARVEWNTTQKLRDDPRITAVGKYLRKYSVDELPQLLNVLFGQMSLVGPRPMCLDQRADYMGVSYYDMRPGLTGLWQVSERNSCSFAERAIYDTRYANTMSFRTDMRILLATPLVVLRGTGL